MKIEEYLDSQLKLIDNYNLDVLSNKICNDIKKIYSYEMNTDGLYKEIYNILTKYKNNKGNPEEIIKELKLNIDNYYKHTLFQTNNNISMNSNSHISNSTKESNRTIENDKINSYQKNDNIYTSEVKETTPLSNSDNINTSETQESTTPISNSDNINTSVVQESTTPISNTDKINTSITSLTTSNYETIKKEIIDVDTEVIANVTSDYVEIENDVTETNNNIDSSLLDDTAANIKTFINSYSIIIKEGLDNVKSLMVNSLQTIVDADNEILDINPDKTDFSEIHEVATKLAKSKTKKVDEEFFTMLEANGNGKLITDSKGNKHFFVVSQDKNQYFDYNISNQELKTFDNSKDEDIIIDAITSNNNKVRPNHKIYVDLYYPTSLINNGSFSINPSSLSTTTTLYGSDGKPYEDILAKDANCIIISPRHQESNSYSGSFVWDKSSYIFDTRDFAVSMINQNSDAKNNIIGASDGAQEVFTLIAADSQGKYDSMTSINGCLHMGRLNSGYGKMGEDEIARNLARHDINIVSTATDWMYYKNKYNTKDTLAFLSNHNINATVITNNPKLLSDFNNNMYNNCIKVIQNDEIGSDHGNGCHLGYLNSGMIDKYFDS